MKDDPSHPVTRPDVSPGYKSPLVLSREVKSKNGTLPSSSHSTNKIRIRSPHHESGDELDVQLLTTILTTTSNDPASWQLSMAPKIQFLPSRYCNAIPKYGCRDGNGSAFVRSGMSRYCPTDLVPYISLPSARLVINSLRSLPSTISRAILQPLYATTSSPSSGCACTGPTS